MARERQQQALELQAQLAEARLQTLRAQIKPHFLFNALNTVAVLMKEDVALAERALLSVCGLLRATLSADDSHQIPLRDELALVEAYLSVEQLRLGERLSYRVSAEPETLSAQVPPMVLQTLVENAVEHGIAPRRAPGRIEVTATRSESGLCLIVFRQWLWAWSMRHPKALGSAISELGWPCSMATANGWCCKRLRGSAWVPASTCQWLMSPSHELPGAYCRR
ncbi:MAG: histidine kinase [Ahniella sp.]|nr:histidine kinase [Ahniella sp.]